MFFANKRSRTIDSIEVAATGPQNGDVTCRDSMNRAVTRQKNTLDLYRTTKAQKTSLNTEKRDIKLMANFDINNALLVYLGGDPNSPGIQPATMQKRLMEFCGDQVGEIKPIVDRYLNRTEKLRFEQWPDSLASVADHVANRLATEMPELSQVVRQKLACYYTYSNR